MSCRPLQNPSLHTKFLKESPSDFENTGKSFLRHGSYCRKAKTRVRSRKKACVACTKAKTRCDLIYPNCSRCIAKNLTCSHELSLLPNTAVIPSSATSVHTATPYLDRTSDSALPFMQLASTTSTQTGPVIPTQNSTIDLVSSNSFDNSIWSLGAVNTSPTYTDSSFQNANTGDLAFSNSLGYPDSVSVVPNEFELTFP